MRGDCKISKSAVNMQIRICRHYAQRVRTALTVLRSRRDLRGILRGAINFFLLKFPHTQKNY